VTSYSDKFAEKWKIIRYLVAGAICIAGVGFGTATLFYGAFEDGFPATRNAIMVLLVAIFSFLLFSFAFLMWLATLTRIRMACSESGNLNLQLAIGPWIGLRHRARLVGRFALFDLESAEGAFSCRIYRAGRQFFTVSESFGNFEAVCRLIESK